MSAYAVENQRISLYIGVKRTKEKETIQERYG